MNQYIITEEELDMWQISLPMSPMAQELRKKARSRPYNPHFAPCIGHKVWNRCPTQEQIRKDEREKVLDELKQWSLDNWRMFFFNNAYNLLILKLKELRQEGKGGEPE